MATPIVSIGPVMQIDTLMVSNILSNEKTQTFPFDLDNLFGENTGRSLQISNQRRCAISSLQVRIRRKKCLKIGVRRATDCLIN